MKINPIQNKDYILSYRANKPGTVRRDSKDGYDEVSFSEEALSFSKIFSELKNQAAQGIESNDEQRTLEVASQIRDGSYFVDSALVAESILGRMVSSINE